MHVPLDMRYYTIFMAGMHVRVLLPSPCPKTFRHVIVVLRAVIAAAPVLKLDVVHGGLPPVLPWVYENRVSAGSRHSLPFVRPDHVAGEPRLVLIDLFLIILHHEIVVLDAVPNWFPAGQHIVYSSFAAARGAKCTNFTHGVPRL